jgi:uncharacterized protein YjbI with pentapeptide repeats
MTRLENTSLKNNSFSNCKLLGIDFQVVLILCLSTNDCILDYASFANKKCLNDFNFLL